jgi:hypothetical protein
MRTTELLALGSADTFLVFIVAAVAQFLYRVFPLGD